MQLKPRGGDIKTVMGIPEFQNLLQSTQVRRAWLAALIYMYRYRDDVGRQMTMEEKGEARQCNVMVGRHVAEEHGRREGVCV